MRINVLFFIGLALTILFFWTMLSGAWLLVVYCILAFGIFVATGYPDTTILYILGAREVRSDDEESFFTAATQEAYKLAVPLPNLYFYNGSFERGFVLQNKQKVSLVLSRSLLIHAHPAELSAICFELLLQVKKGMASKRTKVMFLLGIKSWLVHAITRILTAFIPSREVKQAIAWLINYLLHPWLSFVFKLTMGKRYFKRLQSFLAEFPKEKEMREKVMLKLNHPIELAHLPSKKLIELTSSNRSRHFQNILALELLPHEWDSLPSFQENIRAEKA
jgi:hypothetical protein